MSLLRSASQPRRRASRGVAFGAIVALHGLAIVVAMTVRGPRPDADLPPEPMEVVMFEQSAPPPAPEMQVKLESPQLPTPVLPVVQLNVPVEAPRAIQMAAVAAPPPATPAPPGIVGDADVPVEVSEPDYLHRPPAVYPAAARRARAQGEVQVRAVVDTEGHPREVTVHRSSGHSALDRAACDWVQQIVFKPYRRNGVARSMIVIVPVDYSLKPARHQHAAAAARL